MQHTNHYCAACSLPIGYMADIIGKKPVLITGYLLPANLHGTSYDALAMVNGFGDFASSIVAGLLWINFSAAAGFGYSAFLCIMGGLVLWYCIRTN